VKQVVTPSLSYWKVPYTKRRSPMEALSVSSSSQALLFKYPHAVPAIPIISLYDHCEGSDPATRIDL